MFRLKLSVWAIAREAEVYGEVFLEKELCENSPRSLKKKLVEREACFIDDLVSFDPFKFFVSDGDLSSTDKSRIQE